MFRCIWRRRASAASLLYELAPEHFLFEARVGLSIRPWVRLVLVSVAAFAAAGCGRETSACARCGTVVVAATGDPSHLLPPLAIETVARDIGDQVYERLADLAPGAAPIDSAAY